MPESINLPTEKDVLDAFMAVSSKTNILVNGFQYSGERKRDFFRGENLQITLSTSGSGDYVFDIYSDFGFKGEYLEEANHVLGLALKLKGVCKENIGISINLRKIWESDDMDNDEEREIHFTPHCVVKTKNFDMVKKIIKT